MNKAASARNADTYSSSLLVLPAVRELVCFEPYFFMAAVRTHAERCVVFFVGHIRRLVVRHRGPTHLNRPRKKQDLTLLFVSGHRHRRWVDERQATWVLSVLPL